MLYPDTWCTITWHVTYDTVFNCLLWFACIILILWCDTRLFIYITHAPIICIVIVILYFWTLVPSVLLYPILMSLVCYVNSTIILVSGMGLSITPHTWCRAPLDSDMPGVGMTRMYPMIILVSGESKMELSATQSKVSHHSRGGGHLLSL